jgi:5,5'-dehydrodivanillate O-demethylase oxygenase subunit
MAVTSDQNERLTRYDRGTPCGELFRRYWWPVGVVSELTVLPTKAVRIMGEDLVLFKDKSGRVGLIEDHCRHRAASLLYGRVEERGIACAYHGWLYDTTGQCLETPAEPAGSRFHLTVKATAYPVQPYLGLYWAYLGPAPAPLLPRCGIEDTWRVVAIEEQMELRANWLQVMENNVDGIHFPILHQEFGHHRWPDQEAPNTTRGFVDQFVSLEYHETTYGIVRQTMYPKGVGEQDAVIFPHICRRPDEVSIKVPVDDTLTWKYQIMFDTHPNGADHPIEHWVREYHVDVLKGPGGRYRMDQVAFQDITMMETQGRISDRTTWRLATSDNGVALFHEMLLREMANVEQGHDPKGVVRDPSRNELDAGLAKLLPMDGPGFRGRAVKVYPPDPVPAG